MFSYRNSTKQLTDSGVDVAVISVGSTEQCGPCLPLHLDSLLAEYFAGAWGKLLNGYVLPTLPFNTAEEHASFKGTVTLRPATVMAVLAEIVAGLRQQGFRKQVLTVGHGGSWWLRAFIKDINWKHKDIILVNAHTGADAIWEEAVRQAGLTPDEIHGGALSRALALYLARGDVQEGEYGQQVPEELKELGGYVAWEKITPDGSWGEYSSAEASVATAEAGKQLLEHFVAHHGLQLKDHFESACRLKGIPVMGLSGDIS